MKITIMIIFDESHQYKNRNMKRILTVCLLAIAGVVLSAQEKDWVASWAPALQVAEPHNCPPEPFLEGNSLRQIIQLSTGGDQFRI